MRASRKGAAGACRRKRRRHQGARRPEWVRPYRRSQRAFLSAVALVYSTFHTAMQSERCAQRLPVWSDQRLSRALRQLVVAGLRLDQARRELAFALECLSRDPDQQNGDAPEILEWAIERCDKLAKYIEIAANEATIVQINVLLGLLNGELVPEHPSDRRPRIIGKPRLVAIRAFLTKRLPRVVERITPLLRRRRTTPRPAEIQVPRPSVLGRAPPLSSTCPL